MTPSIEMLLVNDRATVREALSVIQKNALGIAFVVDIDGRLQGVVTDGDARRFLLAGASLDDPVAHAMNANCVSLPISTDTEHILAQFKSPRIRVIPLLDAAGRPVDYASYYRSHRIPVMEPSLAGNEPRYILECLNTNWISSQGPFVKRFEADFAQYTGVQHALAVSSGTAALHLALAALGIGPGDEVIVPDLTFAASANAVLYVGATPVLADVTRETWTLDPDEVARLITPRTRAVMPVHLYGQPTEMTSISEIAEKHGIYIVEDVAEALGSTYDGQQVGTFGDAAAFSFFGNKIMTTGEGGMVTFREPLFADRARRLRDHGMDPEKRYWHPEVGFNYRLTNLQAAIGTAQLEQLDSFIERKVALGATYRRYLSDISCLYLPTERENVRNTYWLFSVVLDKSSCEVTRDDLASQLLASGIETRPFFFPLHVMPPYLGLGRGRRFPITEELAKQGLSLPSAVTLGRAEIEHVAGCIRHALGEK